MMMDLWRSHVAWRLKARPTVTLPTAGKSKADGRPCTKCRKPVEDERYLHCARCRASSTRAAKKRARKRVMTGACPKCGKPRDGSTIVCRSCLAHQRARYHAQGKAGADSEGASWSG